LKNFEIYIISKVFSNFVFEAHYLLNPRIKVTLMMSRKSHSSTHWMCRAIQHGMWMLSLKSQTLLWTSATG